MKRLRTILAALLLAGGIATAGFGLFVIATAGPEPIFVRLWLPVTCALLAAPFVVGWPRVSNMGRGFATAVLLASLVATVWFFVGLSSLPMS